MEPSIASRVVVAVICGVALGIFASKKNRKSWVWTLLGTASGVISLLLTLVVFAVLTFLPYRCPRCGHSLTNKQAREKTCPACGTTANIEGTQSPTNVTPSVDHAATLGDTSSTPSDRSTAPERSWWSLARTLALALNWPCLAICMVGILDIAARSAQPSSGLLVILPFATALAAYHFRPQKWFVVLAISANALWVIACVMLFGFMIAWREQVAPMPLGFCLAMLLVLGLCSLNFALLMRQLGPVPTQPERSTPTETAAEDIAQ